MNDDVQAQKDRIAALYNRVATSYDQVGPDVFAQFGQRVVELATIFPGARVLDVATGRGANLFAAAEKVGETGQVVGIDLAEQMVRETSAALARSTLKNVSVLQMDAENLAFDDASFDRVICNFAIFFFPHLEQAFAGFYRVLRSQGKLAVTLPASGDERWDWYEELLHTYYERYQMSLTGLGGQRRNLATYYRLLTGAGFTSFQSQLVEIEFVYADEDEWWEAKWTHGARTPLERMPPVMLDAFTSEVKSRMQPLKQPDGYHEIWRVYCTVATRIF